MYQYSGQHPNNGPALPCWPPEPLNYQPPTDSTNKTSCDGYQEGKRLL
jgi:hypothetical protein